MLFGAVLRIATAPIFGVLFGAVLRIAIAATLGIIFGAVPHIATVLHQRTNLWYAFFDSVA